MVLKRKAMKDYYLIRLSQIDLGQIMDGLEVREKSWRNTAIFLREGYFPEEDFICEECNNAEEADNIASCYSRILLKLRKQKREQNKNAVSREKQIYLEGKSDGQQNLINRIEADWPKLVHTSPDQLHAQLMSLADDICDEEDA